MASNTRITLKQAINQLAVYHNLRDSSNIYRSMVYDAVYETAVAAQGADANELANLAAGQAATAAAKATIVSNSFDSIVDEVVQYSDEAECFVPFDPTPAPESPTPPAESGFLKNFADKITAYEGELPDFVKTGISFYGNFGVNRVGSDTLGKINDFTLMDPTTNNIKTMIYGKTTTDTFEAKLIDGTGVFGPDSPNITITTMQGPWLTRNVVDASAVALFMGGIPSIEISQAVPYFDVKIINSKGTPFFFQGKDVYASDGLSAVKFIEGFGALDSEDRSLILASSKDAAVPDTVGSTAETSGASKDVLFKSVAGMELFTMPQTYTSKHEKYIDLNPDGLGADNNRKNAIIDTFRPLMTVRDFKYSIDMSNVTIPTIRGTLNIVLHDRSRMQEISPLLRPDKAKGLMVLIEFGWSHPRNDTPYGLLLNSSRQKRKFIVYGADYTFESNGTVNISVNLISAGADAITEDLPSAAASAAGAIDPYNQIQAVVESLSGVLRGKGKVLTNLNKTIPWGKFTTMGDILTITPDALTKIQAKLKLLLAAETKDSGHPEVAKLLTGVSLELAGSTEALKTYRDAITAYWAGVYKKINNTTADDPFTTHWPAILAKQAPAGGAFSTNSHISLGRLLSIMTIPALINHKAYDSIDFQYHRVNPDSYGLSLFPTIASIPVARADFIKYFKILIKAFPNPPMALVIEHTFRFVSEYRAGNSGWGLGGATSAVVNKDGKVVVTKNKGGKRTSRAAAFKNRMTIASNHYYGSIRGLVKPSFRMEAEAVPIKGDETKTSVRIQIYDSADNSYRTFNDVLRAATSSAVGVISKIKSDPASPALPDVAAADVKALERLVHLGILKPIAPPSSDPTGEDNAEFLKTIANYKLAFTDPMQLRYFLSTSMPTIKYGTEFTVIKSAQVSATMDSELGIIQMADDQKAADRPAGDEADDAIPFEIFPAMLSLETLGCPLVRHSQQFFFDYQTNTTIDNIYQVTGIEHNMTPNAFTTSIKMTVVGRYGTFDSIANKLIQMQSAINSALE
jgi:hypothetical protein